MNSENDRHFTPKTEHLTQKYWFVLLNELIYKQGEERGKWNQKYYNSLPESKSMNYQFHLTYPNTPLYVVEGLPTQQELDCNYLSLFSVFIVFLILESLNDKGIKGIIEW